MNLNIVSIGQLKNKPLLEIQNDYTQRIIKLGKTIGINKLQIKEGPLSKKNLPEERKFEEGKFLKKNIVTDKYNIFLDETGEQINSIEIAQLLSNSLLNFSEVVFLLEVLMDLKKTFLASQIKLFLLER